MILAKGFDFEGPSFEFKNGNGSAIDRSRSGTPYEISVGTSNIALAKLRWGINSLGDEKVTSYTVVHIASQRTPSGVSVSVANDGSPTKASLYHQVFSITIPAGAPIGSYSLTVNTGDFAGNTTTQTFGFVVSEGPGMVTF